jgi:hypothetical protein
MIELSTIFLGKKGLEDIGTMPWKWSSMERQRFEAFHLGKSWGYASTIIHNLTTGRLSRQICLRQDHTHVPNERQRSVNDFCAGILDNITGLERRLTTMNLSAAFIGKNASVNIASASYNCTPIVRQGSERYTAINCSMLFLNGGLRGQSLQSVLVFNITNMHAMSDWSDYFPCSCRVNI